MEYSTGDEAWKDTHDASLLRLREAKWYAFDLDDTLHSFRKASSAAVKAVLEVIYKNSDRALEELESEYKRILTQGTSSAFVDGKTSHQYREDRFRQLLQVHNINLDDAQMQGLLSLYERVLTENLELKPGALELLQTLKRRGHKIAVITEGPQDAQERTVEALGIAPYVDYLATTNKLGVTKIDGLFVKVLERLGLRPEDMIMTGDSWERDIAPATQAGIYCVFYSEVERALEYPTQQTQIGHFEEFLMLVETAHR
jgi:putative hydrolase of the HAD superfamily